VPISELVFGALTQNRSSLEPSLGFAAIAGTPRIENGGTLITPWDPGIGILFAVIIHDGFLYSLALFLGVVFAEFITRHGELGLPVILMTAAIVASVYTIAASIAR
jgi:hypothetical protein